MAIKQLILNHLTYAETYIGVTLRSFRHVFYVTLI